MHGIYCKYSNLTDGRDFIMSNICELIDSFISNLKCNGILSTLKKTIKYLFKKRSKSIYTIPLFEFIANNNNSHKNVVIIGPTIDWNFVMFQRPQQLALAFADNGYFVIYLSHRSSNKDYYCVYKDVYVLERWDFSGVMDLLYNAIIVYPQGIYWYDKKEYLLYFAKMNMFFYDYLDAIDENIAGTDSSKLLELHNFFIEHQGCFNFICTSKFLFNQMQENGIKKALLVQNGVNINIFKKSNSLPKDKKYIDILQKRKPIVGYIGALSPWLDYELLNSVAKMCPDIEFCYIGIDYNHAAKNLNQSLKNVSWLGSKNYIDLPSYVSYFDIGIIPFIKGDIAKATSPIKLFEYFSLECPVIITPDLLECKKYNGVFIADTPDCFIKIIREILGKDNQQVKTIMRQCAVNNSWRMRAKEIINYTNLKYKSCDILTSAQSELINQSDIMGIKDKNITYRQRGTLYYDS